MYRLFYPIIILFLYATPTIGQVNNVYSKIKIDLQHKDIHDLEALGVEADHGHHKHDKFISNIYTKQEIKLIELAGFTYTVLIEDVQAHYAAYGNMTEPTPYISNHNLSCSLNNDEQILDYRTPQNYSTNGTMGGYLTYDQAIVELDKMSNLFPNLISQRKEISNIKTHEGRSLYYLVISDNPNTVEADEPQALYTALHHAREPNSLSQLIFYMWYLLENYESDPEVQFLVNESALFFMPIVNPDGYVYNETTNPNGGGLWRKNRALNLDQSYGVDLNRNYGFEWGFDDIGSSNNPTSQTYRGTAPFSEPETRAVKQLCEDHNFQVALNYHTHGNLLIYPWGYLDTPTEDDNIFQNISSILTAENNYRAGTGSETVGYIVNGTSDDWMYGEEASKNKIFSMTPEVGNGFWPARDLIIPNNKATMLMNLNTAQFLHNYAWVNDIEEGGALTSRNGLINLRVTKAGLKNGPLSFTLESATPGVSFVTSNLGTVDLELNEATNFELEYLIDENAEPNNLEFIVKMNNGQYDKIFSFERSVSLDQVAPTFVATNSFNNLNDLSIEGAWGLDDGEFISPNFSLSDSPNAIYQRNTQSEITFTAPSEMLNAQSAKLNFYVKFNIEKEYDFARLVVSRDGINYSPLCGLHTSPASIPQVGNFGVEIDDPIYDGVLDWSLESINLNDYIGEENLSFKFQFHSDGGVNLDGIYIDDLSFQIVEITTSTSSQLESQISVFPNPASNTLHVWFNSTNVFDGMEYQIHNQLGQQISQGKFLNDQTELNIQNFTNGIYFLQMVDADGNSLTKKFIKL